MKGFVELWGAQRATVYCLLQSRTQSDFKIREKRKKGMTLACLEKLAKMQKRPECLATKSSEKIKKGNQQPTIKYHKL